jgi:hypothetical protein
LSFLAPHRFSAEASAKEATMRRSFSGLAIVFVAVASLILELSALAATAPDGQAPDPIIEQAKQLVHDALRAETDGNANLREADLKQALNLAPGLPEAHWQLGEVRHGDRWLATANAEKETTATGKMTEYRNMRD